MAKKSDRAARTSSLATGWTVEGDADGADRIAGEPEPRPAPLPEPEAADAPQQLSNSMTIVLGIFGGLYLAYLWIWFSWAKYMVTVTAAQLSLTTGTVGAVLQTVLYWLAPLAPALWMIAALRANRGGRGRGLMIWLIVGAIVLVPLPFLLGGAASSAAADAAAVSWGAL